MNIKSLLLGSAAALVAVSGARAADAVVVAEPEPAEYVRICDVYGSGYFYIPGTDTCLRIGGYIRYDIGVGAAGHKDVPDRQGNGYHDTYHKQARFSLRTWTGQETELGTLKTYTETRFNFKDGWDGSSAGTSTSLNFAWIQLGGLRIGKDESVFTTFAGYAGNVINDTPPAYGSFDTNLISYYFDGGNGFSAVVSLEEGAGSSTIDSYIPHVVLGAKYTQGWGAITAVGGYDSNYEAFAGKLRVDVNASSDLALFAMAGYGNKSDSSNYFKQWDGSWAVWGGASYTINNKTSFNVQAGYDAGKTLGLAANIAYDIVPGFTVTTEVSYLNKSVSAFNQTKSSDWGAVIRFQRSF